MYPSMSADGGEVLQVSTLEDGNHAVRLTKC
jgi:hypothetical protein